MTHSFNEIKGEDVGAISGSTPRLPQERVSNPPCLSQNTFVKNSRLRPNENSRSVTITESITILVVSLPYGPVIQRPGVKSTSIVGQETAADEKGPAFRQPFCSASSRFGLDAR